VKGVSSGIGVAIAVVFGGLDRRVAICGIGGQLVLESSGVCREDRVLGLGGCVQSDGLIALAGSPPATWTAGDER